MRKRIFWGIAGIALVAVFAIFVLLLGMTYHALDEQLAQSLKSEATYLAQVLEREQAPYDYLQTMTTLNHEGKRVTWVDQNGSVLHDSGLDAKALQNHLDRPEIRQALDEGIGESLRNSTSWERMTRYCAVKLQDGTVLRLGQSHRSFWMLMLKMGLPAMSVIFLMALLIFWTARQLTVRIIAPINTLDIAQPLRNDTYDELSPLLLRIEEQNDKILEQLQQLTSQKESMSAILRHMQEGVIFLNWQGNIVTMNESAQRIFDVPGNTSWEGTHILAVNRQLPLKQAVQTAQDGKTGQAELNVGGRDYLLMFSPAGQHMEGIVLLLMDITESRNAENMRREFSANVSHELKTPLTSIQGYAEIIENGLAKPEDVPGFAGRIYQEAARLLALIQDIIGLSHLDEGKTLPMETVDILALALDTEKRLATQGALHQVHVTVEGENVVIPAIPSLMGEILYNLMDNGIKYNKAGGSLHVTFKKKEGHALVTIVDTGDGIAKEHQDKVFERFYRVDKSHSKASGGTGLGLSIVKHGVRLHKGTISLNSALGKGTEITLRFPLYGE